MNPDQSPNDTRPLPIASQLVANPASSGSSGAADDVDSVQSSGPQRGSAHDRVSSLASSSAASATPLRQRHRRRRRQEPRSRAGGGDGGGGSSATDPIRDRATPTAHRRRRDNRFGTAAVRSSTAQRSQLTLCCDSVTVQRKHGLVIDCVSGLFYSGRLTAVVNCCGTHSAFYLLNALAGQEEADEGNCLMNGTPVTAAAYQNRCAFIDGGFAPFEGLTVRENLDYAVSMRVSSATRTYSVDDVLQQLMLVSVKDKVVRKCSLYVRRRLSLGKELLRNPTVIILDQPLDGLATHEAQQFLTILQKIAAPAAAEAAAEAARQRRAVYLSQSQPSLAATEPAGGEAAEGETMSALHTPSRNARGPLLAGGSGERVALDATLPSSARTTAAMQSPHGPQPTAETGTVPRRHQPPESPFSAPVLLGDGSGDEGLATRASSAVAAGAAVSEGASYSAIAAQDDSEGTSHTSPQSVAVDMTVPAEEATAVATERIVILSMTQPRWALLQYVDEILLLEESRSAFCGPVGELFQCSLPQPPPTLAAAPTTTSTYEGSSTASATAAATAPEAATAESPSPASTVSAAMPAMLSSPLQLKDEDASDGGGGGGGGGSGTSPERLRGAKQRNHLRPMREEFVHNVYRLASVGDGSLSRALGPNANAVTGSRRGGGSNLTALRAAIDRYLQRCAVGEFTLTGWQFSSPGGFVQLLYLFKYSVLQIRNNIIADIALFVVMISLSVVLAAIYGTQEGQVGVQNRIGIIFFLVSTAFLQSILSVESTVKAYVSFQRHRAHGYYPTWVFLTHRVVTCAVVRFFVASVFALVVFLISNFGLPWGQYAPTFELAVIIAITSFTSYFVVFFICTFLWSLRVDVLLLFAVYTVNVVLAGLVLNLNSLPVPIQYLSFGAVLRLSFESCVVTQFWDQTFGCEPTTRGKHGGGGVHPTVDPQMTDPTSVSLAGVARALWHQRPEAEAATFALTSKNAAVCFTGREYTVFLGFDEVRRWRNVGAMAGIAGVLVVLSFLMMTFYNPRRRA